MRVILVILLTLALSGCAEEEGINGLGPNQVRVSRAAFGEDWPLTVDSGVLTCEGAGAVTLTSGGTTYAVNGLAEGTSEYADIDAIWADDPDFEGLKKNIGPLIDRGLALCE